MNIVIGILFCIIALCIGGYFAVLPLCSKEIGKTTKKYTVVYGWAMIFCTIMTLFVDSIFILIGIAQLILSSILLAISVIKKAKQDVLAYYGTMVVLTMLFLVIIACAYKLFQFNCGLG